MAVNPTSELDQRIRDALDAAKMALWEFDLKKGQVKWTGQMSSPFLEFATSFDGTIKGYLALVHPYDIPQTKNVIFEAGRGLSFQKQHRVLFPDGDYHWVEGMGKFADATGDRMVGTIQDITEKKKIELEREDWKQKHQLVATSAGVVVYDYRVKTGEIKWSENSLEMLACEPSSIDSIEKWEQHIHPEDRAEVIQKLDEAMEQMNAFDIQYRFITNKNESIYIHDKGFVLGNGEAEQMLGMMQNITASKEFEMARIESESRFESMIQDMNIGVGLYDPDTNPISCNKQAHELLGMTMDQFLGRTAHDENWKIIKSDGTTFSKEEFPIPMAIQTGKPIKDVILGVFRASSNDWVWLLVDVVPVFYKDQRLMHVMCTYSDITALRKSEGTLFEKNKQLTFVSKELKARNNRLLEFAQIISHNLRSPISSIVSLIKIYDDGDKILRAKTISHIDTVSSNALKTIDELNEVLKVQQQSARNEDLDFDQIMNKVLLENQTSIKEAGATLTMNFEVTNIKYPEAYLESILSNLLSNSLKYRSAGRLVRLQVATRMTKQGDTILEWSDNGLGINLNLYQDDIFQLGKTFHKNTNSRGAGLYLIKNQIQSMGGSIKVKSELDSGTKFTITFSKHRKKS